MKKYILIFSLLVTGFFQINAQESYTYANPNVYFNDGLEYFLQRKFAVSLSAFERFLVQHPQADEKLKQEAAYYIAANSYELRKATTAELLKEYFKNYPYTQFEDRVFFMLGNLSMESKKYEEALSWYSKVKESRLSDIEKNELIFNKGYTYIETKDFEKAKSILRSLRGKNTKYENATNYYYVYAEYSLKNYDAALSGFLAIENVPEYVNFVPFYITQIYYIQKEYSLLIPYAEKTLELNPNSPNASEIHRILGECAYRTGDYSKAINHLTAYEKKTPKILRNDLYLLGVSYFKAESYSSAVRYLGKSTGGNDSISQSAYLYLGNSYMKLEQKTNARMAFQSAANMDFDPIIKEEAAYNYALSTLESTTPFGEAITAFENFLTEYPDSKYAPKIQENLVTAYMSSKNYQSALTSLNKMGKLSPAMKDVKAYVLFQLGTEEFLRSNYDQAIDLFSSSLQEGTDKFNQAQVYYWRAESFYLIEKYDKSKKDYQSFFERKEASVFPDYNLANYNLAYTYFQGKQYKEATPYFLKYVEKEKNTSLPSYTDALDRLGDCYFVARDLKNAEKYYGMSTARGGKDADYASFQKAFLLGLHKDYRGKISGLQKMLNDYPNSTYRDNAYYEMARAYVMIDQQSKAIDTYQSLIKNYPQSPLAVKALLEIGMLHYNTGQFNDAIESYKKVVANYPNSRETQTALESMEDIYVERNNVDAFFAYTRSLESGIYVSNTSKEDSLTYLSAERLYINNKFEAAEKSFKKYLSQFCPNGRSCLQTQYYLADCYYQSNNMPAALEQYKELSQLKGNPYMEVVLVRLSQLAYDAKDYQTALPAFRELQIIAQNPDHIKAARIGVLRCSYLLNDVSSTISIAQEILAIKGIDASLEREARFHLAKAYWQLGEKQKAQVDFIIIAKDLRTEAGAESKYLVADYYFETGDSNKAEAEINDFITKGTPYRYWLARAFVLLADINIKRGDDFQAKQYLLSLQANYTTQDSIQDMIRERLEKLNVEEQN